MLICVAALEAGLQEQLLGSRMPSILSHNSSCWSAGRLGLPIPPNQQGLVMKVSCVIGICSAAARTASVPYLSKLISVYAKLKLR